MFYILDSIRREISVDDTRDGYLISAYIDVLGGWVELPYIGYTKKQAVNAYMSYVASQLEKVL